MYSAEAFAIAPVGFRDSVLHSLYGGLLVVYPVGFGQGPTGPSGTGFSNSSSSSLSSSSGSPLRNSSAPFRLPSRSLPCLGGRGYYLDSFTRVMGGMILPPIKDPDPM